MEIDGIDVPTLRETEKRFSLLLWGQAGCGKTVWACSTPGKKLLINFDPDGPSSLGARDDVIVIDLSGERYTVVDKFRSDDDPLLPLGEKSFRLSRIIEELDISTVIVDSCTAYSQLAVEKGLTVAPGAILERVSPGGYAARNAITLRMMTVVLRLTKRLQRNCIFITHEDDAGVRDKEGNLLHITLLLGGKLGQQVALQISEVWCMMDNGKERSVLIRPCRMRKPLKTRMFQAEKEVEFKLRYEQFGKEAPYGLHSLSSFIAEWEKGNYEKLPVPK